MTTLARPAKLRYVAGQSHERKVTWLELFYDLVFVAAVSQVASPLRADLSIDGVIRFAILFVLIWWAWTGHAVFATRFDSDDIVQRGFALLQMFGVAVMAANAGDALHSRSSAGFAAAYAVLRLMLVAQYVRARSVPEARELTTWYIAGHGFAAAVWLLSALVPAPERYWIWAIAFAIDLGTPWFAVRHSVAVPPDAAHLPERFGLFTLILLGESVVAVMHGIEHQEYWSLPAASAALTGIAMAFGLWWWYFDRAQATAARHVRCHRDAVRLHAWTYAHLPLYLGIVVSFVGIEVIVSYVPKLKLTALQFGIIGAAIAVTIAAMASIAVTSRRK